MAFTVFNTQDSSNFESGLTLDEATCEFWSRNGTVRDYFDALYIIVTDDDFERIEAGGEISYQAVKPAGWR